MKHRCGLRCSRRQSTMRLLVVSVCFWQAVVIAEPLQGFKQQVAAEHQGLGTPSVSIAIIDKSTPRYLNFGLSHSEKSDLVTSDTLYELASISKPKTATATMRLAQLGLVSLDAPISPYIEPLILPISGYQNNKVTLRRIMSHTAGLSVRSYQGFPAGQKLPTIEDSLNGIPLASSKVEVVIEPGTEYRYSSGGFTLVQLAIGMTHTTVHSSSKPIWVISASPHD